MFMTRPKTCCFCIPIFIGILILCIIQILMAAFAIWQIFSILLNKQYGTTEDIFWIVLYVCCVVPIIIGGLYYANWLWKKSKAKRAMLPRAHFLNIVSIVLQFLLITIFGIAVNGGRPMIYGGFKVESTAGAWLSNIAMAAVVIFLNWYWMGLTSRYAFF